MAEALSTKDVVAWSTTYEGDYGIAGGTMMQCAAEIQVVIAAMQNGLVDSYLFGALLGIAQRLEAAANVLAGEEA